MEQKVRCMIHTCNARLWYVEKYLIPSLQKQGVDKIIVYNDTNHEGLLHALMNSYEYTNDEDFWHLQDDVIISSRFMELAKQYNEGISCGFCNQFSRGYSGLVSLETMWYSMPCIRIPGNIFKEFIQWLRKPETQRRLKAYFDENKHDDVFFEIFLKENYPRILVHNIAPNMVNHIDHLLGGSIVNKDRHKDPSFLMATYWDEPKLLIDIEKKLKKGGYVK